MTTHNIRAFFQVCLAALVGLAFTVQVHAGTKDFDNYQVHWSVVPSTTLSAEVAKANNLQRSKGIGIVNITIMKEKEDGTLAPVSGQVEGRATNNVQQVTYLPFRRIEEAGSVSFIAEFQFNPGKMMTFNVTASPTGESKEFPLRFSQRLFND